MQRKSRWIGAAMVLMLAAASVVALTELGGDAGAAENVVVIQGPPPGGGECICPANYDPVVCKASDGSRLVFSNACVAGCSGFTKCSRYAPLP